VCVHVCVCKFRRQLLFWGAVIRFDGSKGAVRVGKFLKLRVLKLIKRETITRTAR